MTSQHTKVQQILTNKKLDAMLFYSTENRFWYSDFISTLGYLLVTSEDANLFVDGRYITEAKIKAKNVCINEIKTVSVFEQVKTICRNKKIKTIGFEADFVTVQQLELWKMQLPEIKFTSINTSKLRMIKDEKAISRIKQACKIGDKAYLEVLKNVKPGMTEKELEIIILNSFLSFGAEKASFDTIVASGVRSSMPHGKASNKIINNNEIITCDFGCIFDGYCSDMTRTFALGTINKKLITIHQIVKDAQMKGINTIRPGIKTSDIHKVCFDYIEEKGYGQYFTHGTGHGLGIEIHEEPYVALLNDTLLEPGMVITVEPGIYIPELGGVRIEDDILVTNNGYEILTNSNRDLDVLKDMR